jgi:hypothetical protein
MDSGTDAALRQLLEVFAEGQIGADVLPRPPEPDPESGRNFLNFGLWIASIRLKIPGVDLVRLLTDGVDDRRIDLFAIEADGAIVNSPEEAIAVASNEASDIRLVFLQAHRRRTLSQQDVAHFVLSVQLILENYTQLQPGANIHFARQFAVYSALRRRLAELKRPFEPTIDLVYCFSGQWAPQFREGHEHLRRLGESNCRNALPGCRVEFSIWGANEMVTAARAIMQPEVRIFDQAHVLPLPQGAKAGFIGYIGARGLVGGLLDCSGRDLDARLFDQNPRHFHGLSDKHNPGAYGLNQLLRSDDQDQVVICNNGVTIVAEAAELIEAGRLRLRAPQVVNGCQTSYVLFENLDRLADAFVPLKIVVTRDEARVDAVVRGANTQRNMAPVDQLSRLPFTRRLAAYVMPGGGHAHRIYFARRAHEPLRGRWPGPVDETLIFTPRHLLETYVAAVLERPHAVHKGIKRLINEAPSNVLNESHEEEIYGCLLHVLAQCRRWARASHVGWQDHHDEGASGNYGARHMLVFAAWQLLLDDPAGIDVRQSEETRKRFARLTATVAGPKGEAIVAMAARIIDSTYMPGPITLADQCSRQPFTNEVRRRANAIKATWQSTSVPVQI